MLEKIKIGHTYNLETCTLSGESKTRNMDDDEHKVVVVILDLVEECEIHEFDSIEEGLKFKEGRDLSYKFLEHKTADGHMGIKYAFYDKMSNNCFISQNIYGLGGKWKLFLNTKSDIVAQHNLFPKIGTTVRFRAFPKKELFYVYLSCLIYILKNTEIETASGIKRQLKKVFDTMLLPSNLEIAKEKSQPKSQLPDTKMP
ncbi:MAG: hypothetical protein EOO07_31115 [Chitinophagaceae bacterium]|nr:MAG: hypothetical protein EOO07_31115 [Chitinophagaceae bacterium]